MIPSFKTYLKESVWMDIHKHSTGDAERREDDLSYVNDMNYGDFVMFLMKAYSSTPEGDKTFVSEWDNSNIIGFPIIIDNAKPASIFLYDYKKRKKWIGINSSFMTDYPDIISIIKKEYKTTMEGRKVIKIYKDDPYENINNMDFIKLIDYLISNIDTSKHTLARTERINESIWMDIHKHSNGEIERKEDDLNNLSYLEFLDYLEKTYIAEDSNYDIDHYNSMSNPDNIKLIQIFVDKNPPPSTLAMPVTINYKVNSKNETLIKEEPYAVVVSSQLFKKYPNLKNELNKKFDVDSSTSQYMVDPKEGKLTNSICVNILDTILGIVEDPLVVKKS